MRIRLFPVFAGACLVSNSYAGSGNAAHGRDDVTGSIGRGELVGSGGVQLASGRGTRSTGRVNGPKIDFSIWQLQLPTGSGSTPEKKSASELSKGVSNPYFYISKDDGGQIFMDPKTGITSTGSAHCRSELRELNADGSQAAWSSTGTNTLTVTGKVRLLSGSSKGLVTIAQVFVSGLNTLAELQYNGSTMQLFYEEAKGNGEAPVDLKVAIPINTQYKFVLSFSKGLLSVAVNDQPAQYTRAPSSAVSGKRFYFKVGNYDQTATAGRPSTTPYTEVEAYSIQVVHE